MGLYEGLINSGVLAAVEGRQHIPFWGAKRDTSKEAKQWADVDEVSNKMYFGHLKIGPSKKF